MLTGGRTAPTGGPAAPTGGPATGLHLTSSSRCSDGPACPQLRVCLGAVMVAVTPFAQGVARVRHVRTLDTLRRPRCIFLTFVREGDTEGRGLRDGGLPEVLARCPRGSERFPFGEEGCDVRGATPTAVRSPVGPLQERPEGTELGPGTVLLIVSYRCVINKCSCHV